MMLYDHSLKDSKIFAFHRRLEIVKTEKIVIMTDYRKSDKHLMP